MTTFDDVRTIALSFDEVSEKPHFEKSSFQVRRKIFVTLDQTYGTATLKLSMVDQSTFVSLGSDGVYPVPGAWGTKGWTVFVLSKVGRDMLEDAISVSYCTVAPKSLAAKYMIKDDDAV